MSVPGNMMENITDEEDEGAMEVEQTTKTDDVRRG
jgi:hypothetical protein